MTGQPVKGNEHILADNDAFQQAYQRAREVFGKIDGVAGVAFGQKETGGRYTGDIAIVVFVREKKPDEVLSPEERIPPSFEGYPTDVNIVRGGKAEACDNTTKFDQVQGGIQIMGKRGPDSSFQGTLGCIVRKRGDSGRENVYLLTNKHVLYHNDVGPGETVYHPDNEAASEHISLGPIQRGGVYGNLAWPAGQQNAQKYFVDGAIARIDIDSTCCGSTCTQDKIHTLPTFILDIGNMADVRDVTSDATIIDTPQAPKKVFKVGRTTGKTTGKVMMINAPLTGADPDPESGAAVGTALNTIMIAFDTTSTPSHLNCKNQPHFTEEGDSGSIVVDEQNRVIGIHSHSGNVQQPSGIRPSHACHIVPVLDTLGICIPVTTGTSHGTTNATDGSGLAPAAASPTASNGDGQIGFARDTVEAPWPAPVPITDDEQQRMRALLDELRTMRKGRELHRLFADLRREAGYLVRNHKLVKVAWHRYEGPAFMAHVIKHLKGDSATVPREVDGVSAGVFLERMAAVLAAHGSNAMRAAIERLADEARAMLASGEIQTAADCIAWLKKREAP
jgi:stage V sporulation protein SpoVS